MAHVTQHVTEIQWRAQRRPGPSQSLRPLTKLKFLLKTQTSVENNEGSFFWRKLSTMTYILYIRFGTSHSGLTVDIITYVDMSCTLYYVLAELSDMIPKRLPCLHTFSSKCGLYNLICFTGSMSAVIFSISGLQCTNHGRERVALLTLRGSAKMAFFVSLLMQFSSMCLKII